VGVGESEHAITIGIVSAQRGTITDEAGATLVAQLTLSNDIDRQLLYHIDGGISSVINNGK